MLDIIRNVVFYEYSHTITSMINYSFITSTMFRIIFGILRDKISKSNVKKPHATRLSACTNLGKENNCTVT